MEWVLITLCVGITLIVLEAFIPSGGIIGILAAIFLLLSVFFAFRHDRNTGVILLVSLGIGIPIATVIGIRYWPRTPMGRKIFLTHPTPEDIDPTAAKLRNLHDLKDTVGTTLTPLRPSGVTEFDDRRVDTITEGMMIEKGEAVRVVAIQGSRVVVRKVDPPEPSAADSTLEEPSFDLPPA